MFRHQDKTTAVEKEKKAEETDSNETSVKVIRSVAEAPAVQKTEHEAIKDLLEKNLKWSQIIYEQNRKIHSKMMWTAIAGWIRVFLILAPLVWAVYYLPGIVKNFQNSYGALLGGKSSGSQIPSADSMEQLFKILPLDAAKQEQLKALLK